MGLTLTPCTRVYYDHSLCLFTVTFHKNDTDRD